MATPVNYGPTGVPQPTVPATPPRIPGIAPPLPPPPPPSGPDAATQVAQLTLANTLLGAYDSAVGNLNASVSNAAAAQTAVYQLANEVQGHGEGMGAASLAMMNDALSELNAGQITKAQFANLYTNVQNNATTLLADNAANGANTTITATQADASTAALYAIGQNDLDSVGQLQQKQSGYGAGIGTYLQNIVSTAQGELANNTISQAQFNQVVNATNQSANGLLEDDTVNGGATLNAGDLTNTADEMVSNALSIVYKGQPITQLADELQGVGQGATVGTSIQAMMNNAQDELTDGQISQSTFSNIQGTLTSEAATVLSQQTSGDTLSNDTVNNSNAVLSSVQNQLAATGQLSAQGGGYGGGMGQQLQALVDMAHNDVATGSISQAQYGGILASANDAASQLLSEDAASAALAANNANNPTPAPLTTNDFVGVSNDLDSILSLVYANAPLQQLSGQIGEGGSDGKMLQGTLTQAANEGVSGAQLTAITNAVDSEAAQVLAEEGAENSLTQNDQMAEGQAWRQFENTLAAYANNSTS